jgi:hypothetical protein
MWAFLMADGQTSEQLQTIQILKYGKDGVNTKDNLLNHREGQVI